MTTQEFSDQFDLFYNNITSNQAPGLDGYEKSVFLTSAQEEIIRAYFNPKENKIFDGFDSNSLRLIDFSNIIRESVMSNSNITNEGIYDKKKNSVSILLPTDILAIINEQTLVQRRLKNVYLDVVPITYLEYLRLLRKPFRAPAKSECWRLINNNDSNMADIIVGPEDTVILYSIRYVKRPSPIILEDLSGVTIEGSSDLTECELDLSLHLTILKRAVELAKASYMDMNLQGVSVALAFALGLSATNMGIATSK